ncbi:MAG: ATP-dependent DNA ligase, partial [Microbacteriaceae bacterium]|nr:ATP-dependent DNA ligase [Microbacteriaceae bacterium]
GDDDERHWLLRLMNEQPDAAGGSGSGRTGDGTPARPRRARRPAAAAGPGFGVDDLPAPMLATSGTAGRLRRAIADGEEWAFEMKWDGYRAIAGVRAQGEEGGGAVVLASRNGRDLTALLPGAEELAGLLADEAAERGGAVLDGELVALDDEGRPDFGLLQAAARDGAQARVRYLVFDVLQLGAPGGPQSRRRSLVRLPYRERRELLERVVRDGDAAAVPPAAGSSLARAERASRGLGLEGVVAKRADSTYLAGRRGSAWVKLKTRAHQSFVVIGARAGRGGREGRIGSLLVAVPDESGELRYAGRVGSGLSEAALAEAERRLRPLARTTPPVEVPAADRADARWVAPRLVGEAAIAGRTAAGRLRQAAWRGWRDDLDPEDVRWEA